MGIPRKYFEFSNVLGTQSLFSIWIGGSRSPRSYVKRTWWLRLAYTYDTFYTSLVLGFRMEWMDGKLKVSRTHLNFWCSPRRKSTPPHDGFDGASWNDTALIKKRVAAIILLKVSALTVAAHCVHKTQMEHNSDMHKKFIKHFPFEKSHFELCKCALRAKSLRYHRGL